MKLKSKIAGYFIFIALFIIILSVYASAYTISFTVFDKTEEKYIYEEIGSNNSNGSRFHDGSNYIIYEFPVQTTDKYVSLAWTIQNQYAVYVNTTDPENYESWKTIYFAEKPLDTEDPSWSTPATQMHRAVHDLSKYAAECKNNKIWIMMGDSDPTGGWGGYISNSEPVVFKTSQTEPVQGAVQEYVEPFVERIEKEIEKVNIISDPESAIKQKTKINIERYRQPELGIICGAAALVLFLIICFIKRSVWAK